MLIRRVTRLIRELWAFLRRLILPRPSAPAPRIPPVGSAPRAGFANSVEHANQRGGVPKAWPEGPPGAV